MSIYDLPSNSHASKQAAKEASRETIREASKEQSKEPEKRVKKVVSGKVKTRENKGKKFASIFIAEDFNSVTSYMIEDVIAPNVKKLISEAARMLVDTLLWGKDARGRSSSGNNKISYRSYYDDRDRDNRRELDRPSASSYGSKFNHEDLVFETRADAEAVRMQMADIIDTYDFVSIGDMYDMADRTAPPTAFNYGWYNVSRAEIVRVYDGYIIKLPKASPRER